ncbi:MAG: HAD hydrolase-like protein [archaeon]
MKHPIIAFDFDGVIIDTAYESYVVSIETYHKLFGRGIITDKGAKAYSKGRCFSLNAKSNLTLVRLCIDHPEINFDEYTQELFDEEKKKDIVRADEFAQVFLFIRSEKRKKLNDWIKIQKPFVGIKQLIHELLIKYNFYIVSTKDVDSIIALLKGFEINVPIEKIIADDYSLTKEKLLNKLAKIENVPVDEIVLFDDALKQLVEARKIGVFGALAMWGEKRSSVINAAEFMNIPILYSTSEVLKFIEDIINKNGDEK